MTRPLTTPADPRVRDASGDAAALRRRAESVNRGAARAAVLGVNDGLVTTVCLILAVAGASSDAGQVRVAGLASLIAGAFSMAAGEWVSVRSQAELSAGLVDELRGLVQRNPRLVIDELASHLSDVGFAADTAQRAATELPLDEDRFYAFASRTLFGFDADQSASSMTAALSSLSLFAAGAIVPLAPWFFTHGATGVLATVVLAAIVSVAVGGWVGRSSGRPVVAGAVRQLIIVIVAAAVTYGIGKLFGTAVS